VSGGVDAAADGGSVGFDGWLDVMGELVAQVSGSITALFGF
jgi:hypothetical protein